MVILDTVDDLVLADEQKATNWNALKSLDYMWSGLEFLNKQVDQVEAALRESLDHRNKVYWAIGNAPELAGVPQGLIACAFHWYATSSCNFVRLVDWLGFENNPRRADGYVSRTIPTVRVWRNKVGAHFAITDPRKEDTAAILESSVMFPIGYVDGVFRTQPFTVSMRRQGQPSRTRNDMSWSLTEVHQGLARRYEGFLQK